MRTSPLKLWIGRCVKAFGFSWSLIAFMLALLITETRSVGQEIVHFEGQELPSVMTQRKLGSNQLISDLRHRYEAQHRRDPFLPLVFPEQEELSSALPTDLSNEHKPKMKLLGIMSGMQGYYASIQNSGGKRYIVGPGSVIRSEGLKIKQISDAGVEFEYLDERKGPDDLGGLQMLLLSQ